MVGFMMPLTEVKNIKEFLLVPSLWGCCYGQPPAVNHIVVVKMPPGQTTKFYDDVIRIRGQFDVGETKQDGLSGQPLRAYCGKNRRAMNAETPTVYKAHTESEHISLRPVGCSNTSSPPHTHAKLDRLGIWLSAACAVHCMVMPIVLIFFPVMSWIHWSRIMDALVLGVAAIFGLGEVAYSA